MNVRNIASPCITLLLAALLIGYLVVGKLLAPLLQPRIMIILAAATILHGGWSIVCRCLSLAGRTAPVAGKGLDRLAGILEIAMLLGLLLALSLGLTNYLLGFQGYLEIIPGGEEMPLGPNLQIIEQGAFSHPRGYALAIRGSAFVGEGEMLRVQVRSGGGTREMLLKKGDVQSHAGLRLAYQGDGYLVALSLLRGSHDYLAAPVVLRQQGGGRLYRARLDLAEPGAGGEVTLDPASGSMNAVVQRKGVAEFDGRIQAGAATQGEMRLQVTSFSHFGRVLVQHRTYRTETLAAIGLFVVAGLARLILGRVRSSRPATGPAVP